MTHSEWNVFPAPALALPLAGCATPVTEVPVYLVAHNQEDYAVAFHWTITSSGGRVFWTSVTDLAPGERRSLDWEARLPVGDVHSTITAMHAANTTTVAMDQYVHAIEVDFTRGVIVQGLSVA